MIYLADDYVEKYESVFAYLIGRSIFEGYTFDFIEKRIAYSNLINELERSNVTSIAFSSMEKSYSDIFPNEYNNYDYNPYDIYAWVGYAYIHLFLKLETTFEALFFLIPIKEMLLLYDLYHEMDINRLVEHTKEIKECSTLDVIMKRKKMSCTLLAYKTEIPLSTIKAIRYGIRDIEKLEAKKIFLISRALNIKIETLLPKLYLDKQSLE